MRILFLGNHEAQYSSESYYTLSFKKLGHEVIKLQERKATAADVLSHKDSVDCFFWVKTHGWETPGMINVLDQFKQAGKPTFGYHLDLYMGLERWKQYEHGDYFQVEHFFTVDKLMAEWLNTNTKTKGHFLPAGVPESECFLGTPNHDKYPHEIIFTGSKGYHKEYPYRVELIEWLHRTYGNRFAHYGGGGLPTVRGPELNNLYASAKIVIGDTLCKNFDYPEYLSDRAFEVPGRGGFMIFPYIKGIQNHYKIGEEIISYQYGNFGQLKEIIDLALTNDSEREKIRMAGFIRAKKDHTYEVRLKSLLKTVFG